MTTPMKLDPLDPLDLFFATFSVSSLAGLAAVLRSGQALSWRSVASAALNSGCLGLGIAFVWYHKFHLEPDGLWFLMGVSLLAGLGGTTFVDFLIEVAKRYITGSVEKPPRD